ncbi:unnamed protein product, partial [Polarella glacialis]
LGISDQPFNAFVGRLLKNSEIKSDPAAQAAILSELGKLRAAGAWSESTVIEWSLVRDNAVRSGKKVHVGRLHAIATEKGSELPLGHPERKMKGRIVFLGNNVRDEDGQVALFGDLKRPRHNGSFKDAYIQSPLGGAETYIRLPKELQPDSWKHMRDPVCKLVMSLYGHPDAGGFWQAHCKNALESVGFIEVSEAWQSLFYHPELKVMMAVYVDDFKASGPVEALKKAWTLARSKIRTGAPTPIGRHLGCHHNVVELKDRRIIEYDTHDFLEQCVSRYKKVCGEDVVLKKASTPFLDEDKLPEEDDNEPGKLADAACSVLMKVLHGVQLARFDLLKAVAGLASKVTKWSVSCDKRLFRFMCYINDSKGLKMRGYVGRDDKAEDLFLRLFADADFAGCRDTARSTSGVFLGPKVCQLLKFLTKSLVELTESAFVGCTKFFKMDNARSGGVIRSCKQQIFSQRVSIAEISG